jgi:DNA primase large subunit
MKRSHARYPFLAAAREAVKAAGVDLAAAAAEPATRERARERVTSALTDGTVGEPRHDARTELLSYPLARVLVSLVDVPVLTRKYARAEAASAHERFVAELETPALKSTRGEALSIDALLAEFDLRGSVHETPATGAAAGAATETTGTTGATGTAGTAGTDGAAGTAADRATGGETTYRVDVGAYLPLAADMWGDEWRLVNRALADGRVPVSRSELLALVEKAVEERVAEGLPLAVPAAVAEELEADAADLEERLAELDLTREIDAVVPELFPPCMTALLDGVQKGEHLAHHSRFAITAFLTSIGLTTDEVVELYTVNPGFGEEITRYQTDHIRGETSPTEYSPPSCATMQSYGDCVNMDDRCETISHPMAYYEKALDDADEDGLTDWRERDRESEAGGAGEA